MFTYPRPLPAALLFSLLSLQIVGNARAADVTVAYEHPEQFSEMPTLDRDRLLGELKKHFDLLGKSLPPDQHLAIDVTDLTLAGRINPARWPNEIRVLHGGADWPTMHLRYKLEANGKTLASGEDDLSNMNYLNRLNNYPENDDLRYEKQMIDDWFTERFGAAQKR